MQTIIDQLTIESLISSEKMGDGYKLYSVDNFKDCDDVHFWEDISRIFGVKECILVQYKADAPSTLLKPLIWKQDDELVYRVGNTMFPLVINDDRNALTINNLVRLDYDTINSNGKEYISFSYLVLSAMTQRPKGTKPYDINTQILFVDDFDPTEISKKAKSLFKKGDFEEVIETLLPYVREIPIYKNSASLAHIFQSVSEKFKLVQQKLGGTIAVVVEKPSAYMDKTYHKQVIEFSFDGKEFSDRLGEDYLVKSWGQMKPLSEINFITFSEGIIKNNDYLSGIAFRSLETQWAVLIITAPNNKRTDWPPSISFVPDYLLNNNENIRNTISKMMGKNFKFPDVEKSNDCLPTKKESKFLKAVNDFSYDDEHHNVGD